MKQYALESEADAQGVEINISPLIDIVFLLLIFFIVSAVFIGDSGVAINRPSAMVAVPTDHQSLRLAITADGNILHEGRRIGLNSVRAIVSQHLRAREVPVLLEADAKSHTALFVSVHDECKLAGAEQIYVATRKAGD